MANYNLTLQQIRNSFNQLAQVSGSVEAGVSGYAILDGTGSRANTLHVTASYATTASYAPNTGVTSIIAGTNITVDQSTGDVTINSSGGGGGSVDTGSLLVTASNVDATITYTKGDGSQFQNIINNVAFSTEAEDLVITVKNTSGGTLAKGTAVHAVGVTGQNVNIIAASNDSALAMPAIGILSQQITNNGSGTCIIQGRETGISTTGLSAGDPVYVHLAGALTATKPTGSALIQNIGTAAKINGSDGEIIVQGAGRTNDLPNLTTDYVWKGDSDGVPQAVPVSGLAITSASHAIQADSASFVNTLNQSVIISGSKLEIEGANSNEGLYVEGGTIRLNDKGTKQYGNVIVNYNDQVYPSNIYASYQILNKSTGSKYATQLEVTSYSGLDGSGPVMRLRGGANNGTDGNTIVWSGLNDSLAHFTKQSVFESALTASAGISTTTITASNASFTSASIGYLQTVTGSATIIGSQYVVVNADSPTARFAGIKVYDSGSGLTGSFEWDSVDDNWIQVETGGSSAGMLTGASGSKGSEAYPTSNTLLKGTGNHTVVDSIIVDNGTNATINGDATVTGNTQLNGELNFSTFVDLKQQSVNILTGSAAALKLRSTDFSVTDLSDNVSANFTNTGVSIKKGTQITGSLIVSQSGLSSGDDVFVLGAPRGGGSSLEGIIRSTVDDGLHLYGNKFFNTGANTFSGGITGFESGPVQLGAAGSPVSLEMQNNSAITASGGTLPIKGDVDIDGDITVDGGNTTINIGNSTTPTATPNLKLFQAYNGTDVKFANISINDTTGTYGAPSLFGRFSNPVSAFGNAAGDPFTVIAGGAAGGAFNHWGLILDQTGDIKSLKEMNMYSGAKVSGSLAVTGSIVHTGSLNVQGQSNFYGQIIQNTGQIQALGGNGGNNVTVGNSGYGLQYPSVNVFTNSGSYGDVYASHRIEDLSGNGDFGTLALSTFNAGDPGRLAFETQFNNDVIWWISENENRFHVEKELKAKAGAQITGSLVVTGSQDLTGALDVSGVTTSAGGVRVGVAGSAPVQFPSMQVNGDSGLGSMYAAFQISDDSTTINGQIDVSTFTGLDGSNPVFRVVGANTTLMWASVAQPYAHMPALVKAQAGMQITGSLDIDGQVTGGVTSLAIASTTASMDFNDGNFFNLTLANGVDTHLDATNVAAGQTISLVVTNNATGAGTLSFSPDFKFAGGTAPTVTAAVDAVDILTFVTTDATSVYGTGLLNFS